MGKPGPKPGSTLTLKPHDTITEGDAIGVLLSNWPDRVWVDRADYDRIVAAHGHRAWSWVEADQYVRIRLPGGTSAPVARLVLKSQGGGCVHFADEDRLNLRRRNLSIQAKRAPYAPRQAREKGQPNAPRRPAPRPSPKPSEPREAPTLRPFPQAAPKPTMAPAFTLPERPPITVVRTVKRDRQR